MGDNLEREISPNIKKGNKIIITSRYDKCGDLHI